MGGEGGNLARGGNADIERHAAERLADVERLTVPVVRAVVVGAELRVFVVLSG